MLCFPVLKASSCRALTTMHDPSADYRKHLRNLNQGKTQTPQRTRPVKAQSTAVTEPMGSRASKDKPTSSSHHETTGSSAGRESRTSERNSPATRRSSSQQPERGQHSLGNYPEYYSEKSTNRSEYDNGTRGAHQRSDRTTSSLMSDATSRGNLNFGGTVICTLIDSLLSRYGSGAGASAAAASPVTNFVKVKTEQPGFQSRGSSYAQIASMHTSAVTSESNSQSNNGRQSRTADRSGTTRIRSASQGLRNLGNTCYMNSILQCLAKVPWFADGRERRSMFHDDLLNEFFSLMKKLQENDSNDSSLNPYQFRQQISSLGFRFSSSEQNDAHEFLLCLLSRLSKTLKSDENQDIVADILLGRQQNVIRFKKCKHVLINDQPFFSLSLPLTLDSGKSMFRGAIVSLFQCLENYTRTEDVDGDALCMDCQLMQLCSIEASFKCPPKILIIHLKRYDFARAEKLENEVSFPLKDLRIRQQNLNASGEVVGYNDVTYDLFAVCNHYGSLRFGHYTADIKSPSNHWYNYSDSRVTQIHRMSSISREACILFYRQSHS